MRVLILGNAGTGKSTLAKRLSRARGIPHLDLDTIAWDPNDGIDRLPLEQSLHALVAFTSKYPCWVIEGCHTSLMTPLSALGTELLFLNPGIVVSESHCRSRPYEPHKFPSEKAQNDNLEDLIEWMKRYEMRDDEFSLRAHREFYETFQGPKRELLRVSDYPTE